MIFVNDGNTIVVKADAGAVLVHLGNGDVRLNPDAVDALVEVLQLEKQKIVEVSRKVEEVSRRSVVSHA